jgi:hypothetical protein
MSDWQRACRPMIVLAIGACTCAASATTPSPTPARVAAGPAVSLDQAITKVEHQLHARVVRADAQSAQGHTTYVLRLLNDAGRVWTVQVDAASGAIR